MGVGTYLFDISRQCSGMAQNKPEQLHLLGRIWKLAELCIYFLIVRLLKTCMTSLSLSNELTEGFGNSL